MNDPAGTGIEGTFIVNRVPKFYIRVLAKFRAFLQAHVSICVLAKFRAFLQAHISICVLAKFRAFLQANVSPLSAYTVL